MKKLLLIALVFLMLTVSSIIYPMIPQAAVVHSQIRRSVELHVHDEEALSYYLLNYSPTLPTELVPFIRQRFMIEKQFNVNDYRRLILELLALKQASEGGSPSSSSSVGASVELHNYMYEIVGSALEDLVDKERKHHEYQLAKKEHQIARHKEDYALALRKARLNACVAVGTAVIASAGTVIATIIVTSGNC